MFHRRQGCSCFLCDVWSLYGLGQTVSGIVFYNIVSVQGQTEMKNISEKQKAEEKRNHPHSEPVKIVGVSYGTKSLTECMEAVMKLAAIQN